MSPKVKKPRVKRILSDLSAEERVIVGDKERSLLKEDPSIKEAVVNPDSVLLPPEEDIIEIFPTPEDSPQEVEASAGSTLPSRSEFDISPPENNSVSAIIPMNLNDSQEENRGSSAGTSNEVGKFDRDEQSPEDIFESSDQRNNNLPDEEVANPQEDETVPIVNQEEDPPIVFNIDNAMVAGAALDNDQRPIPPQDVPEHVLIVVEDFDTITHVLTFQQAYDPEDILNAFWNRSINVTFPDEGFEATASITPIAPPPTPTSSTEAVNGSAESLPPSTSRCAESLPSDPTIKTALSVAYVDSPDTSGMMILNISDKPSLEEQAEEQEVEGEEEEEEKKKGEHAN